MAELPQIVARTRQRTGKGGARQARRDGFVPGIVYGGGPKPVAINIPFNHLFKSLKKGRFLSTLFNLKIDDHDDVRVICRGVQRDVVKDLPIHVDLMRLNLTSRVNLFIPTRFINEQECTGLRRGGVLTVVRPEIELKVTANNIPSDIEIDLTGLDIGDVVTISSVELPKGTRPMITDRDFVIANISAPSGLRSTESEEEEGVDEVEETETPEDETPE
ncbi:MAG: 50S ribosomal protein L25/general stress protein Ctc [Paracoccaceae bacterium]|nr:50S ribosomal protein L25/general stress protein Ctc [Paracoccaceae bacterium]MDE2911663.1 50S ribosomal protein L25/general stress protein Ctc [Paracoccaceae bacterium]